MGGISKLQEILLEFDFLISFHKTLEKNFRYEGQTKKKSKHIREEL